MIILKPKSSLGVLTKVTRNASKSRARHRQPYYSQAYHTIWQQKLAARPFHASTISRAVSPEKQKKESSTQAEREEAKDDHPSPPSLPYSPSSPLPDLLPHISPSPFHSSLPSFLTYASRVGLSPTSNVYVGTRYEYVCQTALRRFGFSLVRTGGAGDVGLDLLGTWTLPGFAQPLRALVQCKFRRAKPGPILVRELEGAFLGGPVGWRDEGDEEISSVEELELVGVLCVPGQPTKSVREAVKRSGRPVVVCVVEEEGEVRQFFWNKRVERLGLEGWEVGVRYTGGAKEAVLLWRGEAWESENEEEHEQTAEEAS